MLLCNRLKTKLLICGLALGACDVAIGKDVRDIELRRLFEPTVAEQRAETSGRIYIYESLRESDVSRAMEEEFDRVENMMFIRVKQTDEKGREVKDKETGAPVMQDDGC
jgi:hypothetical protein